MLQNRDLTFPSSIGGGLLVGLRRSKNRIPTMATAVRPPNTTLRVSRSMCVLPWNFMNTNKLPKNML